MSDQNQIIDLERIKRLKRLEEFDSVEMLINKALINDTDLQVKDHPEWKRLNVGDHVEIISWDTQSNVQECVRLSKLPYLTIKKIIPMIVGYGKGRYYWAYTILVEESHLEFLQWHYKLL